MHERTQVRSDHDGAVVARTGSTFQSLPAENRRTDSLYTKDSRAFIIRVHDFPVHRSSDRQRPILRPGAIAIGVDTAVQRDA